MSQERSSEKMPQALPPGGGQSSKANRGMMMGPPPIEAPKEYRKTVQRLMRYFGGNKTLIVVSAICIAAATIFRTLGPMLIGKAISLDLERSLNMHSARASSQW